MPRGPKAPASVLVVRRPFRVSNIVQTASVNGRRLRSYGGNDKRSLVVREGANVKS